MGQPPGWMEPEDFFCDPPSVKSLLPRVLWTSNDEEYRLVEYLNDEDGDVEITVERRGSYDAMRERGWVRAAPENDRFSSGELPALYAGTLARQAIGGVPGCTAPDCGRIAIALRDRTPLCRRHLDAWQRPSEVPF